MAAPIAFFSLYLYLAKRGKVWWTFVSKVNYFFRNKIQLLAVRHGVAGNASLIVATVGIPSKMAEIEDMVKWRQKLM